jgi:hypothetical protein
MQPFPGITEFSKTRRANALTDEELVRFHVGRRLLTRNEPVDADLLARAQDRAAELVQHSQMQVAIDEACALAQRLAAQHARARQAVLS